MADARQSWRPVETRLVSEYLAVKYPAARHLQRVRVGSHRPDLELTGYSPAEARALGVWRRWADAVVVEADRVTIIEASVLPVIGKAAQLWLYMQLWPATPEHADIAGLPVSGLLLYAVPDPVINQFAVLLGMRVDLFRPAWVETYLHTLPARSQRAPLSMLP
jgi:hypothetical protein